MIETQKMHITASNPASKCHQQANTKQRRKPQNSWPH